MKQLSKPPVFTALCAGGGFLCLLLRQWLFSGGTDGQGLFIPSHPANILCWVLTGLTGLLAAALFFTWDKKTVCAFAPTPFSGVGSVLLACGYAAAGWQLLTGPTELLRLLAGFLAILSLLCTLLISLGQFRGDRMHPLLYCPGVLFFLCYLVCCYPGWSGEPQAQTFFFQMMFGSAMLVTVFCRAELAAGNASCRNYLLFSRVTVFLALGAIPRGSDPALYLLCALALIADGCQTEIAQAPEAPTQGD